MIVIVELSSATMTMIVIMCVINMQYSLSDCKYDALYNCCAYADVIE